MDKIEGLNVRTLDIKKDDVICIEYSDKAKFDILTVVQYFRGMFAGNKIIAIPKDQAILKICNKEEIIKYLNENDECEIISLDSKDNERGL